MPYGEGYLDPPKKRRRKRPASSGQSAPIPDIQAGGDRTPRSTGHDTSGQKAPVPKTDYSHALDSPFGTGQPARAVERTARRRRRRIARERTEQILDLPNPPAIGRPEGRRDLVEMLGSEDPDGTVSTDEAKLGFETLDLGGRDVLLGRLFRSLPTPGQRKLLRKLTDQQATAYERAQRQAYGSMPEGRLEPMDPELRDKKIAGFGYEALANDIASAVIPEGSVLPEIGNVLKGAGKVLDAYNPATFPMHDEKTGKVLQGDARFVKDALTGALTTIYGTILNPTDAPSKALETAKRLPQAAIDDIKYRWGPAVEGNWGEFDRRLEEQGGLTYLADMIPVGGAVAKGTGLALKAGVAGQRGRRFVTRPRPEIELTQGYRRRQPDETRKLAPSVLRIATQRRRDRRRAEGKGYGVGSFRVLAGEAARREKDLERAEGAKAIGEREGTRRYARGEHLNPTVNRKLIAQRGGTIVAGEKGIDRIEFPPSSRERLGQGRYTQVRNYIEQQGFELRRLGDRDVYFPVRAVTHRSLFRERFHQRRIPAALKGEAVNLIREEGQKARKEFDRIVETGLVRRKGRGISKEQKAALYYVSTGRLNPEDPKIAVRQIDRLIEAIENYREPDGPEGERRERAPVTKFQRDEIDKLKYLRAHAKDIFGPRLRDATDALRTLIRTRERENPFLTPAQRVFARYGPQAVDLEADLEVPEGTLRTDSPLGRLAVPIDKFDEAATVKSLGRQARKLPAGAERRRFAAEARLRLDTPGLQRQLPDKPAERNQVIAIEEMENRLTEVKGRDREKLKGQIAAAYRKLEAIQQGELHEKPTLRLEQAYEFAARVRGITQPERIAEIKTAMADLNADWKRWQEADLSERPAIYKQIEHRQREHRKRLGEIVDELPVPAFAPSERFDDPNFRVYTAQQRVAPQPFKQRTYELQRLGVQRTDPEIIYEGIQRNIQMRISSRLVAETFERTSHPRYRDMPGYELKLAIEREGWALDEVDLWFPRIWKDRLNSKVIGAEEDRLAGKVSLTDLELSAIESGAEPRILGEALGGGGMSRTGARVGREHSNGSEIEPSAIVRFSSLAEMNGFFASPIGRQLAQEKGAIVPRAVSNEIKASVQQTAIGRGYERLKSAQSRAVLGTFNIPWLVADTMANHLIMGLVGGAGPINYFRSFKYWRDMDDADRTEVKALTDIGAARSQVHLPHLGAAGQGNRLIRQYRAIRNTPLGRKARPLQRSITAFLRLEKIIANDPPRRALFYKLMRQEAFQRLDREVGFLNGMLGRLQHILTMGPERQLEAILRNQRLVEDIANQVEEILGDWSTFTWFERQTVGRLFFYPYLRYSMRLVFYTLPLNHPVRLAIISQLGALSAQEQQELIAEDLIDEHFAGLPKEEKQKIVDAITGSDSEILAGRYFIKRGGKWYEFSIRNANPFGNVFTEADELKDLIGLAPPIVTMLLGQIFKRDIYRSRDWRVHGSADSKELEHIGPLDGLLGTTRYRILANELLRLPWITRELMKWQMPGEHGNDSLPFSLRETQYKDKDRARQAKAKKRREQTSLKEAFLRSAFRAVPAEELASPSDILEILQRRYEPRTTGGSRRKQGIRLDSGSSGGIHLGTGSSGGIDLGGD